MPRLCSNADCSNELTPFELKRIEAKHSQHSKYRYCVKCRRYRSAITRIRCQRCECIIYDFQTIFQTVCKDCAKKRHRVYSRKLTPQQRADQLRGVVS